MQSSGSASAAHGGVRSTAQNSWAARSRGAKCPARPPRRSSRAGFKRFRRAALAMDASQRSTSAPLRRFQVAAGPNADLPSA